MEVLICRKTPNFSYVNDDGKIVSGAAATLHEIYTNHDGVRDYNDDVGKSYIQEFVKVISEGANADIQAKSKRKNIKIS